MSVLSGDAYYNENDPYAAAWLRSLIAAGHIAPGDVDERSIADVRPDDLRGYVQCHFFAGIGGWSYALRLAGWPDSRPCWTGSCPCQPYSAAGKRRGDADERNLWPHMLRLIAGQKRRVPSVFGEQVASKDGRLWLAGVRADLEALGYAVGAADLCSAGIGAPHIRQRLWWYAGTGGEDLSGWHTPTAKANQDSPSMAKWPGSVANALAGWPTPDTNKRGGPQCPMKRKAGGHSVTLQDAVMLSGWPTPTCPSNTGGVHQAGNNRFVNKTKELSGWATPTTRDFKDTGGGHLEQGAGEQPARPPGPSLAFWSDYDLLHCTDGKARRIEPGSFPLAHGVPARVGRLRGYGNAINPHLAAAFIAAVVESHRGDVVTDESVLSV